MNATPYGRNEAIYEKRKSGMTLSALAKEYDLSAQRITQICSKQERRERHPYINELLAQKYPEEDSRTISIAVNALVRYWANCGYLNSWSDRTQLSIDQFVQLLSDTDRQGELSYVRGLGDKGIIFLKKVMED